MSKNSQALRGNTIIAQPSSGRGARSPFLDILPITALGAAERRRVDGIVEAACPGAEIVGAAIPGRSWDIRPIVIASDSRGRAQSLIRLFGPEVTLSVELTERVGESLANLQQSSPRSALLIEYGTYDGQYWLRRAVVPETLAERLAHGAQLSFAEALRIGRGLIDTVQSFHAQGVVHGHIGASNVYTSPSGDVGLIDPLFGLAVVQASQLLGMEMITSGYDLNSFAPESISREWPSVEADLYGIGKVFWSLFSKVRRGEYSSNLSEMSAAQLREIREIILAMNSENVGARLTFEEILERFDEFADEGQTEPEEIHIAVEQGQEDRVDASDEDYQELSARRNAALDTAGTASFSKNFLDEHVRAPQEEQNNRFATTARIVRPATHRVSQPVAASRSSAPRREEISEVFFSSDDEELPFAAAPSEYEDLSDEFDPRSNIAGRVTEHVAKPAADAQDFDDDLAEFSAPVTRHPREEVEELFDEELPDFAEISEEDFQSADDISRDQRAPRDYAQPVEQERRFAPKPQRPKQTESTSRARKSTENLKVLFSSPEGGKYLRHWGVPAVIIAVLLAVGSLAVKNGYLGLLVSSDEVYAPADLRSAWMSGIPSRMAAVAEAAVGTGPESRVAEELIVGAAVANDKSIEMLGGGAQLLRVAFDKRWEMSLSDVDRRQAIRLASAKLLGEKAYALEAPLETLNSGVILALASTAQDSAAAALNNIRAARLRDLPPPIGPAFAELTRENQELRCGEESVRMLARFAATGRADPTDIHRYVGSSEVLLARLRPLAILVSHDQAFAGQVLTTLLSHPNIKFQGEVFTWAEIARLRDWNQFDAADQLFVLAGIAPAREAAVEYVRWMRGHPAPELRQYALMQTLDRVKLNHPAGLAILSELRAQPAALGAFQTYDLSLVLEKPRAVTAEQAKKWLQSGLPQAVLERMVIEASRIANPTVVDMEIVAFLEQNAWAPTADTLQQLSLSPQKYFRLLAVSKIYKLQDRGLASQLLEKSLEREQDAELRTQIQMMAQILSGR